ncbi:YhcN/YlaJ family sporulation lipoprotein [Bacillus sp. CHD6a]|uniref:YhcN/YlaJ family sporulation lipoprotein n=1 Tax=Bacillus sp. CHD6a TaxID=1643452 RepID=UPI000761A880|nr:YhcN/YlaJ family sporulation lipoprotein [Bacillus sp. CHD6a]
MRKSLFTVTSAALLVGGLSGCGQKESATDNRYYEETRPIGYYTSEHNPYVNNDRTRREPEERGNARLLEDNDGPLNEILDRSVIYDEKRVRRNKENGVRNATNRNYGGGDLNIGYDTPHYSRTDQNYHGHLNGIENVGNPSYYNNYDGNLANSIVKRASKVDGVDDARVLINGDEVLVAVNPENGADDTRQLKREVRQAVKPLLKNKDVRVAVDASVYSTVRSVDNDLRNGEWHLQDLDQTMRGIYRTMTR